MMMTQIKNVPRQSVNRVREKRGYIGLRKPLRVHLHGTKRTTSYLRKSQFPHYSGLMGLPQLPKTIATT